MLKQRLEEMTFHHGTQPVNHDTFVLTQDSRNIRESTRTRVSPHYTPI